MSGGRTNEAHSRLATSGHAGEWTAEKAASTGPLTAPIAAGCLEDRWRTAATPDALQEVDIAER